MNTTDITQAQQAIARINATSKGGAEEFLNPQMMPLWMELLRMIFGVFGIGGKGIPNDPTLRIIALLEEHNRMCQQMCSKLDALTQQALKPEEMQKFAKDVSAELANLLPGALMRMELQPAPMKFGRRQD